MVRVALLIAAVILFGLVASYEPDDETETFQIVVEHVDGIKRPGHMDDF